MIKNEDNYDLGYIEVIKSENNLGLRQKFKNKFKINYYNDLSEQKMNKFNNNRNNKTDNHSNDEEFDENIGQYYGFEIIRGQKWFLCKFGDCEVTEIDEKLMKQHIRQHSTPEDINTNEVIDSSVHFSVDRKFNPEFNHFNEIDSEFETSLRNNKKRSLNSSKLFICDRLECHKTFTYFKPFERHLREHEIKEKDQKDIQRVGSSETAFNDIEKYIEVLENNGKEMFLCEWSDCEFISNTFNAISDHIRSEHLIIKPSNCDESNDRQHFWAHNREEHQRSQSNSLLLTPKKEPKEETVVNNIKVITNQNNTRLSCKGLASTAKVKKFFHRTIVNGVKIHFCNQCDYSNKSTQKIAEHINIKHFGLTFKCDQPNCSKVYLSTTSWREHQKNHLCGFGLLGYRKKVKGICGNENINKYRERVLVGDKRVYRCKWNSCGLSSTSYTAIKRHIHNQHVCPFRLVANLNQNRIKKDGQSSQTDGSKPIATKFLQMFKCKRRGCKARFTVRSDLLKHENIFCFFRPVTKNANKSKFQANNSNNSKPDLRPQTNQLVRNRLNAEPQNDKKVKQNISKEDSKTTEIVEHENQSSLVSTTLFSESKVNTNLKSIQRNETNIIANNDKPSSVDNIEKYFKEKVFDGVKYYLCQWNDCKFTNKFWHKIIDHIQNEHIGCNSHSNNSDEDLNNEKTEAKRKYSSIETPNDSDSQKVKQTKSEHSNENNVNERANDRKPSTETQQSINKYENYMTQKSIDGEPNYFCNSNECYFYSKSLDEITKHINQKHINQKSMNQKPIDLEFKCDEKNCSKSFKTRFILRLHKKNHICGFGIEGRIVSGVCNIENVEKYRKEIFENNKRLYECKWNGCEFVSDLKKLTLNHIHNQHICPNRNTDLNLTTNEKSDQTTNNSKLASTQTNKPFGCKINDCNERFNAFSDLVKHEKLLCKKLPKTGIALQTRSETNSRNNSKAQSPHSIKASIDESNKTANKSDSSQLVGSYGTETSIKNFEKYSKLATDRDGERVYVCKYPDCCLSSKKSSKFQSYTCSAKLKGNMIRHIRRHTGDKPFVCHHEGCDVSYSCPTQFKNHQIKYNHYL